MKKGLQLLSDGNPRVPSGTEVALSAPEEVSMETAERGEREGGGRGGVF